jgi:Flp pilus assembly protein protease CpaA
MFDILIIKIILVLLACGIAAYTDYKTGLIQNWLTYPLILFGLLITIFESFLSRVPLGLNYFLNIIIIGILIYGIGYLLYRFGKLGGGDVKLFIGIHLVIPYYLGQVTILWLLIVSSLLSVLIVSTYYLFILKQKLRLKRMIAIIMKRRIIVLKSIIIFIIFFAFVYIFVSRFHSSYLYFLILLPILVGLKLMIFEEEVKKYIYLKQKPISKLEDGDVLALEYIKKDLLKKLDVGKKNILEEEDIKRIKKIKGLRTIPIYDSLPRFGPFIFFGLVIVLLFGVFIFF